ncbi:MAG TPA: Fe-Mn family superoxide dismutase [Candidatus Paceibacterota bacterium]
MKKFEETKFNIPTLKGMSAKNIEEHLKLYAGYIKNANLVLEKIEQFSKDPETNTYVLGELNRRFSFEFNGIVNHEYYFEQFESGPKALSKSDGLFETFGQEFGSFETWLAQFKTVALTRGIGWAMLYYDPLTKRLLNQWVDEQHLGQLNGCQTILALDMWEHAYVADYQPSGKKNYIEDFFANLSWEVVEKNFESLRR